MATLYTKYQIDSQSFKFQIGYIDDLAKNFAFFHAVRYESVFMNKFDASTVPAIYYAKTNQNYNSDELIISSIMRLN